MGCKGKRKPRKGQIPGTNKAGKLQGGKIPRLRAPAGKGRSAFPPGLLRWPYNLPDGLPKRLEAASPRRQVCIATGACCPGLTTYRMANPPLLDAAPQRRQPCILNQAYCFGLTTSQLR